MKSKALLVVAISFLVVGALGVLITSKYYGGLDLESADDTKKPGTMRTPDMNMMMDMMRTMMQDYSKSSYGSNGERIYLIGQNEEEERVSSNMPRSQMMEVGCANCHGPKGRGGLLFPDGKTKSSNITWAHLGKHKPPYNEKSLERAIRRGVEPDGDELNSFMPRFDISDDDLDALIDYLKTL